VHERSERTGHKNLRIRKRDICIAVAVAVVVVCGATLFFFATGASNEPEIRRIETILTSAEVSIAMDLAGMVRSVEFIIVGEYTGFDTVWNMSSDPKDYVEGRFYSFRVDEVLKGQPIDDVIFVNHHHSRRMEMTESNAVINEHGEIVVAATKTNEISFTYIDLRYIEPEIGPTYILFLQRNRSTLTPYGISTYTYYASIEPFMIKFENDTAFLQSNIVYGGKSNEQTVTIDGTLRTIVVTQSSVRISDTISGMDFDVVKEEITGMVMQGR